MLTYPATIALSTRALTHLAALLRAHRVRRGTRWRRLVPGCQALLVLAQLRNGDTPAQLAGGFGIGATTAWRYIREAVDLLAAQAPRLDDARRRTPNLAYVILDGTLICTTGALQHPGPVPRRRQTPLPRWQHPGPRRPRRPPEVGGTGAARRPPRPDRRLHPRHPRRAGRRRGDHLRRHGLPRRRRQRPHPFYGRHLPAPMRGYHRCHAKIRAIGARAVATLKSWKLLTRLHCCPTRATTLLAAILILQLVEERRYPG